MITLKNALEMNINDYPIKDSDPKEHIVKKDDKDFCFDCYYLVVFVCPDHFEG